MDRMGSGPLHSPHSAAGGEGEKQSRLKEKKDDEKPPNLPLKSIIEFANA